MPRTPKGAIRSAKRCYVTANGDTIKFLARVSKTEAMRLYCTYEDDLKVEFNTIESYVYLDPADGGPKLTFCYE